MNLAIQIIVSLWSLVAQDSVYYSKYSVRRDVPLERHIIQKPELAWHTRLLTTNGFLILQSHRNLQHVFINVAWSIDATLENCRTPFSEKISFFDALYTRFLDSVSFPPSLSLSLSLFLSLSLYIYYIYLTRGATLRHNEAVSCMRGPCLDWLGRLPDCLTYCPVFRPQHASFKGFSLQPMNGKRDRDREIDEQQREGGNRQKTERARQTEYRERERERERDGQRTEKESQRDIDRGQRKSDRDRHRTERE